MSGLKDVWVFAEKPEALAELCAGGRELGQNVSALVIGSKDDAEQALGAGADHVYWLDKDESRMLEDYTLTVYDLLVNKQPNLLLVGASKRAKLIAGRLAAKLGTSVLTDVMEFVTDGGSLQAKRMVYGGAAIRTEQSDSRVVIATVGAGLFKPAVPGEAHGDMEPVAFIEGETGIKRLERRPKGGTVVNLNAAKRIVAVGRGIAREEDLKMIEEFAGLINAEIGCTRPVSEGEGWLPRERYIGVSGVMQLKPEVYIAVGISGQVQHMVGCNQSRTIYAINNDKNAPIFKQCDYGVAGDLYKVLPQLIEKLKANK